METKNYLKLFITICILLSNFLIINAQEIKLIGFNITENNELDIVKWSAGSTAYDISTHSTIQSVYMGTSTFDVRSGKFYVNAIQYDSGEYQNKLFSYDTNSQIVTVSPQSSIYNGGSEVDMESGLVYSYDFTDPNNPEFKMFNPSTQAITTLGVINFDSFRSYYHDSSCFDSNLKIFYFTVLKEDGIKELVTVNVNSQPFSYTILPIPDSIFVDFYGLEFSNKTNKIYTMSNDSYEFGTPFSVKIGILNPLDATVSTIVDMVDTPGYEMGNKTFDQETNSYIFVGVDAVGDRHLKVVNTVTGIVDNLPLPSEYILEFECDNSIFAVSKYGVLGVNENITTTFSISPNPTRDFLKVNYDGVVLNYSIIDVMGKIVASDNLTTNNTIDVNELSNGMYILKITTDNEILTKKFIVN
ncbi:T9SS type A sorting domain-containing protein [Flavobacterium azooxidireducens]|uniref:T9SS type A sorting domain-containing protein n=1 Tax=Flavobacterium azooxidireducens TaxID=1871076 RepID=A0ABY4KDJ9_9FLAO|nr:T9SS type A sorting domain-containing protein [Flavobacterium azooxidireducens]UPQ78799.1 T9SS type A sorting domain-containing protein [Flavobacterium azooxidireducens]